jgi:hypothetical protein
MFWMNKEDNMATEKRLIDADVAKETIIDLLETEWGYEFIREDLNSIFDEVPTVDAVPVEKYNALKERYERTKEIADILDAALRQYQRQYGE